MVIQANEKLDFENLNKLIRETESDKIVVNGCIGQRYIGAGLSKDITINGTAGNATGAYLTGGKIVVNGNAEDAVGDTMNNGTIIVNGSVGDALGYAMRGGKIFVKKNVGYRAGVHMKAYENQKPVIVIGENAGNFLGEYLAGGIIIVLGLNISKPVIGNFCGTGMYGGAIYLRTDKLPYDFPKQNEVKICERKDLEEIESYVKEFCNIFGAEEKEIFSKNIYKITASAQNKYKQTYVSN